MGTVQIGKELLLHVSLYFSNSEGYGRGAVRTVLKVLVNVWQASRQNADGSLAMPLSLELGCAVVGVGLVNTHVMSHSS